MIDMVSKRFPSHDLRATGSVDLNLTLKVPITTAADYIHKYFFNVFQRK